MSILAFRANMHTNAGRGGGDSTSDECFSTMTPPPGALPRPRAGKCSCPAVWQRKLKLKAKFESSLSFYSFKR